jgi:hypothetical protein
LRTETTRPGRYAPALSKLAVYPLIILQFGVQIMDEEDQLKFGFDLLDPTKIVPEELVPITKLGKLTLNRNPTNYFAETEQVMVSRMLNNDICNSLTIE